MSMHPRGLVARANPFHRVTAASYATNGLLPAMVADIRNDRYFYGQTACASLLDLIAYSATTPRTLFDAKGVLKWGPMNLVPQSNNFTGSAWANRTNTTLTPAAGVAPDGTNTAWSLTHTADGAAFGMDIGGVQSTTYKLGLFVKHVDHQWFRVFADIGSVYFDLVNQTVGFSNAGLHGQITPLRDGWVYLEVDAEVAGPTLSLQFLLAVADGSTTEAVGTSALIWGAHAYENTLGGMAEVPAAHRAHPALKYYLPNETSAQRFLPRTMGHRFEDGRWVPHLTVDEGAATNLLTNSEDFTAWVNNNVDVTADGDGFFTVETTVASNPNIYHLSPVTSGTQYCGMVGVRAGSLTECRLEWFHNGVGAVDVDDVFIMAGPGTLRVKTGNTVIVENLSDTETTWLAITGTPSVSNGNFGFYIKPRVAGANIGDSIKVRSAMFFAGRVPTSHIPTYGTARTRTAETFTQRADRPLWPSGAAGSRALAIAMQGAVSYADSGVSFEVMFLRQYLDASNQINLALHTNGSRDGDLMAGHVSGGMSTYSVEATGGSYDRGLQVPFAVAGRWGDGFVQAAAEGAITPVKDATPALPDLSATPLEWATAFNGGIDLIVVGIEPAANRLDNTNGPNTLTAATGRHWP